MRSDCIGLDEHGRAVVRTRAWSRLLTNGQGELAAGWTPGDAPLKLAEAYMPAPLAWMMLAGSSAGVTSGAVLGLAFGTLEGALTIPVPLNGVGFTVGLGGPVIAASSIAVELASTSVLLPGERISVCIAPVAWPDWAVPDEARRLAALIRGGHASAR